MQTTQKITELLSRKYLPNISILGNYLSCNYTSILDTNNGTIFIVSNNHLISFKDQNKNHWFTIIESFQADGKQYYPQLGDFYTLNSGIQYSFTTKEDIIKMATAYFEQHT